tara:strand:+ start:1851 stop:2981 length:1131 start_codon:yes stop_codon:yes gene_type:complete
MNQLKLLKFWNKLGIELIILREPTKKDNEIDCLILNMKTDDLKKIIIKNFNVFIWQNYHNSSHLKFKLLDSDFSEYIFDFVDELRFGNNGSGFIKLNYKKFNKIDIKKIALLFHFLFDKKEIKKINLNDFFYLKDAYNNILFKLIIGKNKINFLTVYILRILLKVSFRNITNKISSKIKRTYNTIIFIGVDGSGKTTIAKKVINDYLNSKYIYNGYYGGFFWISRLISNKVMKKKSKKLQLTTKNISNKFNLKKIFIQKILNLIKLFDFILGVRFFVSSSRTVFMDRSLYDSSLINKSFIRLFIPRSKLLVHLDAANNILLSRKKEHSSESLDKLKEHNYITLSKYYKGSLLSLKNERDMKFVITEIKNLLNGKVI